MLNPNATDLALAHRASDMHQIIRNAAQHLRASVANGAKTHPVWEAYATELEAMAARMVEIRIAHGAD